MRDDPSDEARSDSPGPLKLFPANKAERCPFRVPAEGASYGPELPYPDSGQDGHTVPVAQGEGNAVRLLCPLVSLKQPPVPSRNFNVPLLVPRIAIQYVTPDVTLAPGIGTVFHAPAVNEERLPCAINVPGWPEELV